MEEEIFDSCENCPYDENGWCCCEGDLPDDALCMKGYEDDQQRKIKKVLTNHSKRVIIIIESEREVIIMKIYVFESTNDVVIRKAAKSIDEAIAWFKATYPTRAFSCVYEQQAQER